MTPKHIMAAEIREIKAIEIRCRNCAAVIAIPVERRNVRADLACPGCNEQFWAKDNPAFNRVKAFVESLYAAQQEGDQPKFSLGFSLDAPN